MGWRTTVFVSYALSLGGFFGLHHLFLERPEHALVYLTSLGGFCGWGLLRDLWCIPAYATTSLQEPTKPEASPKPSVRAHRILAMFMFARFYALVFSCIVPKTQMVWAWALALVGVVAGVVLIARVGDQCCSVKRVIAACLFGELGAVLLLEASPTSGVASYMATLCAIAAAVQSRQWRAPFRAQSRCHKLGAYLLVFLLAGVFWILVFGGIAQHALVCDNKDDCTLIFGDFSTEDLNCFSWPHLDCHFDRLFARLSGLFDPHSRSAAFAELELKPDATESDIKRQYRNLARKWHPDKNWDNMELAKRKMAKINSAYEVLTKQGKNRETFSDKQRRRRKHERDDL